MDLKLNVKKKEKPILQMVLSFTLPSVVFLDFILIN